MLRIAALWRHPIKGHGHEALSTSDFIAGKTMPWDRKWAVAHEAAKTDGRTWASCANFSRGGKAPQLMAVRAVTDTDTGIINLSHPDAETLSFAPDGDTADFLAWCKNLMPQDRAQSVKVVRADVGMTDTPYTSISLLNTASLADLSDKIGADMAQTRFRGNIWIDGAEPWDEFNWIGKEIRIGTAEFEVVEPITRCLATHANPQTGERDADVLNTLTQHWGHKDFGVYLRATKSGHASVQDKIEFL